MITLHHGGGSGHYWVEEAIESQIWEPIRQTAVALLQRRGKSRAADTLAAGTFALHRGGNDFDDEFYVLYRPLGLEDYVAFDELARSAEARGAFAEIAKTLSELGFSVRFVGVELVQVTQPTVVASPRPKVISGAVEAALHDAELLLANGRMVSAVDRVHTALHGYLREICESAEITTDSEQLEMTALWKRLREQHPKFIETSVHKEQTTKVVRGLASVCDALNPLRNSGSLAHPNEDLLRPAEAMLAINASRTILRYVHDILQS